MSDNEIENGKIAEEIKENNKKSRKWKCVICSLTFIGLTKLQNHYDIKHEEGPYTCPKCGVEKDTILKYKMHLQSHNKVRSYKCIICDIDFQCNTDLTNHIQSHGKGPFNCKICRKEKSDYKKLKIHMTEHLSGESAQCEICTKYMLKRVLKDHMGYHTGISTLIVFLYIES